MKKFAVFPSTILFTKYFFANPIFCDDPNVSFHNRKIAGYRSAEFIKSGDVVGLGTGTTVYFTLQRMVQLVEEGVLKDITVIPSSEETRKKCIAQGLNTSTLRDFPSIDICIDGADEVDADLRLVKGSSGCFLREQIVQSAADKVIIVIDDAKLTKKLGTGKPIPVEIVPFSHEYTRRKVEGIPLFQGSCRAILRRGNLSNQIADGPDVVVTDNGNFIIDLYFSDPLHDITKVVADLNSIPGVVSHGLQDESPSRVFVVSTSTGVVTVGKDYANPWWGDSSQKFPLPRLSLDNRDPVDDKKPQP